MPTAKESELVRLIDDFDQTAAVPVYVVWELTLACNLKCTHCGSRAGFKRTEELTTSESISLVEQMAQLGTREITLIGGEAFIRRDWLKIISAINRNGMRCSLQTGAYKLSEAAISAAVSAGLSEIGVSIDGMEDLHDRLRGVDGSFQSAISAIDACARLGVSVSVNTQITSETVPDLEPLMNKISDHGVRYWQVQLTVPMGNAVDNCHLIIQPYDLLTLMPILADLYKAGRSKGLLLVPGNNVGYFGPYESLWRGSDLLGGHYPGCAAGHTALGIEADGTIKSCPSLPKLRYSGGNIRDISLAEVWKSASAFERNRRPTTGDLWGYCRECYYSSVCRAGCTWMSDSLFGRPGNNPYCHYRALIKKKEGVRERVTLTRKAINQPFSTGMFELTEEPINV
ncbi:MAG: radical SAM protein [Rhodobacteraceae bacterium]|nr:radical SAM protein [Paracoccaceae bacterium]